MSHDDLRRLVSDTDLSGDEEQRYGSFRESASPSVRIEAEAAVARPLDPKAYSRQLGSSLGFCLGGFAMGNALGWSSSALPQLEASTSPITVTQSDAAWIGSLVCLGALCQGPLTGYLMTKLGRRASMILSCLPLVGGWFLILYAKGLAMLLVGRFITGYAAGSFSVIAPVYIGEIASPEIRGALGTCFQIMVVSGIFAMYVLGAYVSWKMMAIFSLVMSGILIVVLYSLQDSPTSYMMRGRPELARKAIVWLRNSADIEDEIYAVQKSVLDMRHNGNGRIRTTNVFCISDPSIRKPLLISVFIMMNQQLSGINAVITFTVNIFQSAGSAVDPNKATMIIGGVQLVSTVLSSLLVNKVGRRSILIVTQSLMAIALITFGTFFYLKQYQPATAMNLGWVPLSALVLFIISFSFGLGPLAWLILGEVLSPKVVGVAGGVASMINWSLAFAVTLGFPFLVKILGDYGTYWLFAVFCIMGVLIVIKYLPETRNKSLREIQEAFIK